MPRLWLSRLNALFLAVMLAGGGSGLPLFDALFHHLGRGQAASPIRVQDPDTTASHAERCTLGGALPALVRAAGLDAAAQIGAEPIALGLRPPAEHPRSAASFAPGLPRAPPVSVA